MKNKIISLILNLILFSLFSFQINASEQAWGLAQEGNKIILIRHSLAPGGGDPAGFKIDDCKTQRNLNKKGINQSKKIGKLFKKNQIFKNNITVLRPALKNHLPANRFAWLKNKKAKKNIKKGECIKLEKVSF